MVKRLQEDDIGIVSSSEITTLKCILGIENLSNDRLVVVSVSVLALWLC